LRKSFGSRIILTAFHSRAFSTIAHFILEEPGRQRILANLSPQSLVAGNISCDPSFPIDGALLRASCLLRLGMGLPSQVQPDQRTGRRATQASLEKYRDEIIELYTHMKLEGVIKDMKNRYDLDAT
jgi:hypothetical protein